MEVNQSVVKRENRLVVAVRGALGYNEVCQLKREMKGKTNMEVTIFCGHLVTTKEYLGEVMPESK